MQTTKVYTADGSTKIFQSDRSGPKSSYYLAVFLGSSTTPVALDDYSIINNAVVFNTAPTATTTVTVQTSTTDETALQSPFSVSTVASNIADITSVADNMTVITNAATYAVNADTSATNAATSASNAATSASTATTGAGTATTKAAEAVTSAGTATTKAAEAVTSAANASTAKDASVSAKDDSVSAKEDAVAALASFEDVYLGSRTSDPSTTDTGSWYFNSGSGRCRIYNGSSWEFFTLTASNFVNQTSSTGAAELPAGDATQRPSTPATGSLRWNTSVPEAEIYNGTTWVNFGGGESNVQADWDASQYLGDGITPNDQHILNKPSPAAIADVSGTVTLASGITDGEVRTAIDAAQSSHTHSSVSTSAAGFAPQLPGTAAGKFLKADSTWEVPPNDNTQLSDADAVTAVRTNSNIDALVTATSPLFTDTDTNTTYTAATDGGLNLSGTELSLDIAGNIPSSTTGSDAGYFATVPQSGTGLKKVAAGSIALSGFNNDLSTASSSNDGLMTSAYASAVDALLTNKLDGTTSPAASNDTSEGYDIGSTWIDVTNDKAYICLDSTTSNAVWTEITSVGGGGGVSLPVSDATWIVKGNLDATKQARLECDNLSTGGSVVMTVPTSNGTLSTLAGTETLTNKTLTSPVISSISNTGTLTLPTASGTVALTTDITGTNSGTNSGDESSASATYAGIVELATTAEVDTGTDTTRAVTPEALSSSALQSKVNDIDTDIATAKAAAETAAASDATTKADAAQAAAETTAATANAALTHDGLTGFVANEHLDWTTDRGATNIHAGNYTDTNTTYSAGTGMSLSGTQFNCTVTDTNTTYSGGTGLTLSSTTFNLDGATQTARGGAKMHVSGGILYIVTT